MHKLLGADLASSMCVEDPDGRDQILVDPHLTAGDHVNPVFGPRSCASVAGVRQLLRHDDKGLSSFAVAGAAVITESFGPDKLASLDGLLNHFIGRGTRVIGLAPAVKKNLGLLRLSSFHIVTDSG